jgi:DNA-binding HxlR family transcriptional regulator
MVRSCPSTDPECPVARAIAVLQEKWVLHIVHTLLDGPRGFNELGREVGGCNPTTLTQRLAKLEDVGLVTRTDEHDGRGRGGYRLTASGEALSDVIEAIHAWSLQHLHRAEPLQVEPPARRHVAAPRRPRDRAPVVDGEALSAS